MIYLIGFDLKRYTKQTKTWIMLSLVLAISLLYLNSSLNESNKASKESTGKMFESIANSAFAGFERKDIFPDTVSSLNILKDTGEKIKLETFNPDEKEFNRLTTFGYLLLAKDKSEELGKLRERAFKYMAEDMWDTVSDGINYDSITYKEVSLINSREYYYEFIMKAKFHYYLYENNLNAVSKNFIDSSIFPYHYMNKILPLLMGVIITLLLFDCISAERMNESIKLILSQPISRNKYIIAKIISGFIYSSFIIITPMIVITLIYGMMESFQNITYPVLYLKQGFSTLKSIDNYLEFDKINQGYNMGVGISLYSGIPKGNSTVSPKLGIIPLYQFLLLALLLVLLYILFMVILNVFLSSLMKNKLIGFIGSFLITVTGTAVSSLMFTSSNKNISPFTMNNSVRILSGTYNVTPLSAVLILSVSSLIILIISVKLFNKRNL